MTFEQMKENLKTIKLLEKDLMRDLTDVEREIVINKGWEEFLFKHLGFTDEDFSELKAIKSIISAFYTQDEDAFAKAVRNAPESVYFVLRDIIDEIERLEPCECPEGNPAVEEKKDPLEDYVKFMQELYLNLPKGETPWFNKLTEDLHEKLFTIYKSNRNETQDCSDDVLSGIMTDAVKDEVIKALVEDLKAGKTVEMTNDEYLEVADFLAENENKFFLNNNNGKVTLKMF